MLTLPPFPCRAGDVCAFISNTRFSQAVHGTFPNVNNTVDNAHTYLASIPQACLVLLPWLGCLMGHKGPSRESSPNSPLGKVNSGAGGGEGSSPALTPYLCPCSKSILSSTAAISHWAMPTTASRVRVCGRGGLEHPCAPLASCSSRASGAWGPGWLGVLCGCVSLPCRWLLALGVSRVVLMGMSNGSGFGGSSRLLLCSSCCFSPFRLLSGEGDASGGRMGVSLLSPPGE